MADFAKLWLQGNQNSISTQQASAAIQSTGRALPCTVIAVDVGAASLLTVKFEANIPYVVNGETKTYNLPPLTLPKAESQWLRAPVQIGDVGLTIPADTFLGGISGLGTGVANLGIDYGNLSTLAWVPIATTSFGAAPNLNQVWANGPAGAVVSDTAQTLTTVTDKTSNSISSTVHAAVGTGATTISTVLDGANNKITHSLTNSAGAIQTIVDGNGNAISHVLPTGGLIGLGALASSLPSTAAVMANSDVSTFENSLHTQRLSDLENLATAVATALASASPAVTISASAIIALIASLAHISVPSGSSVVRVAGG